MRVNEVFNTLGLVFSASFFFSSLISMPLFLCVSLLFLLCLTTLEMH